MAARARMGHVGAALPIEAERGLAFTQKLDVDAGEQQGIQQRAVLGALGQIDAVALAQRIQAVGAGRMTAPRQHQRIDDAVGCERRPRNPFQLGIDESEIERGIVRNQWRIFDKAQELVGHVLEERLVLQEIGA